MSVQSSDSKASESDVSDVSYNPPARGSGSVVTERPSRRRFFAMGVSLAAATVASASSAAAQQGTPKPSASRDMVKRLLQQPPAQGFDPFNKQPVSTQKGWNSALTRLVRRVTNGVTEDELKLAHKLGYNGYLNYHLAPSKIDDAAAQFQQDALESVQVTTGGFEAKYNALGAVIAVQTKRGTNQFRGSASAYSRMVGGMPRASRPVCSAMACASNTAWAAMV